MRGKGSAIPLLLIGAFSMTQIYVVGAIGVSELVLWLMAPFLYMREQSALRQAGFSIFFRFLFFAMIGCVVSAAWNRTDIILFLKGIAPLYSLWASVVVLHHYLRRDLGSVKWLLVGFALTLILNVFFLHQSAEAARYGSNAMNEEQMQEGIMSSPVFWISRLGSVVTLPGRGWFLQVPIIYSALAPIGMAAFAILTSESGRSASVVSLAGACFILLGGKSQRRLRQLSRRIPLCLFIGLLGLAGVKTAYTHLAGSGMLGEKAQKKFEDQSKAGTSTLKLLMAGRGQFFMGGYAAIHSPLIGFGPAASDKDGYAMEFLRKYGDADAYADYLKSFDSKIDLFGRIPAIPAHSALISFWLWYGLPGLIFWFYIFYLFWEYLRKTMPAIPQWFCMFATSIPSLCWHIFFSGYDNRVQFAATCTCLLLCRAVHKGRIMLPPAMYREIQKHNK